MLERIKQTRVALSIRKKDLFDDDWRFSLGEYEGAETTLFDDTKWRTLCLPHDWSIEGIFDESANTGGAGAYLPAGIGWYRKYFTLSQEDLSGKVLIQFDGVMYNSTVYVNGNAVGTRPYGYISFSYDLTPYVHEGENTIVVKADNSHQPSSRWYAGAGIYRHVYLIRTGKAFVPFSGIYVTTPEINRDRAIVQIRTEVKNEYTETGSFCLQTRILAPDGNVVAEGIQSRQIACRETSVFQQSLEVRHPHLWSLDTPEIYRVHVTVMKDRIPIDDEGTYFGIRKLGYSLEDGFSLNGEPMLIKGLCMHHNMGCCGAAVPERLLEETLLKLKAAGCNGIRLSHYPHSPEMLALLDTIGFVCIGEAFDEWARCRPKTAAVGTDGEAGESVYGYAEYFKEWNERDLTDYLRRDRNHPCIAFWSIGNEIFEQNYPEGGPMARDMVAKFHTLDPTRPVTAACCNTSGLDRLTTTDEYMEALDIIGVNYVDHWGDNKETYYFRLHEKFPDKILLGTEHVNSGGIRGKYSLTEHENRWYTMYYNKMIDIEMRHKFLSMHPYVLGDYIWTGIDYLGEAAWPWITPATGVLDTCGFEKDGYYLLRSIWQKERPVLDLVPTWNYEGHEGEAIPVICYTNCEYVELFLNGQSYGKQSWQFPRPGMYDEFFHFRTQPLEITTSDLHLTWMVPYQPGELKAVGYADGREVMTTSVRTAGPAAKLRCTVSADEIVADGQDAVKIAICITDVNGILVPHASDNVRVKVEGNGTLLGMDNGSPYVHNGYRVMEKPAFNGMLAVVIRAGREEGDIRVFIDSEFDHQAVQIGTVKEA